MQVLFDLQKDFHVAEEGELHDSEYFVPVGDDLPELAVKITDDVKSIIVKNRPDQTSGIGFELEKLPSLRSGDRITVTGRIPRETPMGSWGIALSVEETDTRKAEECQLAQITSPKVLFALSYILCKDDLHGRVMVQTTRWGAINPLMDISIDSVLVLRDEKYEAITEDTRDIVYSLATDERLLRGGTLAAAEYDNTDIVTSAVLAKSGNPNIVLFDHNDAKAIHVINRNKDWDGVDINMGILCLEAGNKYQVTVTGKIDGEVPDGTIITLQGLPDYSWRTNRDVGHDDDFTLQYTLGFTEVEFWTTVRITTNATGASVPFFIHSIEIKRLGLL